MLYYNLFQYMMKESLRAALLVGFDEEGSFDVRDGGVGGDMGGGGERS